MSDSIVTPEARDSETQDVEAAAIEGEAFAAAGTRYPVVTTVNVRSGPGTSYQKVGTVSAGSMVTISCQKQGQSVLGPLGTSTIWDCIGSGRYVSDTYVRTGSDGYVARRC